MSVQYIIDIEVIARRVVEQRTYARFSTVEQLALCQWVLDRIGEDEAADVVDAAPTPSPSPQGGGELRASLAALVASTIIAHDRLQQAQRACLSFEQPSASGKDALIEAIEAFSTAFTTLKTRFEKEFPHAGG